MKYFLDTEFIECAKQRRFCGLKIGAPVPTIDLISIGIVAEDGREFYALNADCELDYAWADAWVRKNVLLPIWHANVSTALKYSQFMPFELSTMKAIFKQKGTPRQWLGWDILKFTQPEAYAHFVGGMDEFHQAEFADKPTFYGYYCDYDWVVMCQLFGRMMNLPKSFPMFCIDLKQEVDRLGISSEQKQALCPDPEGEHNALVDAQWNQKLYQALLTQGAREVVLDMNRSPLVLHFVKNGCGQASFQLPVDLTYAALRNGLRTFGEGLKTEEV